LDDARLQSALFDVLASAWDCWAVPGFPDAIPRAVRIRWNQQQKHTPFTWDRNWGILPGTGLQEGEAPSMCPWTACPRPGLPSITGIPVVATPRPKLHELWASRRHSHHGGIGFPESHGRPTKWSLGRTDNPRTPETEVMTSACGSYRLLECQPNSKKRGPIPILNCRSPGFLNEGVSAAGGPRILVLAYQTLGRRLLLRGCFIRPPMAASPMHTRASEGPMAGHP